MPRLFTGIEIPAHICERLGGLRGGLSGARWIDPENYHLTLRFLGDIDDARADDVVDLLSRVRRHAFTITLDGLGSFGGRRPRAIWARVLAAPQLMALQAEHEQLIQRAGLAPEQRRYTPHVTLARLRCSNPQAVAAYMESRGGFFSEAITVRRFVLFSSQPSRGGGPYLVEETYPLDEN
jgi:2'-5' RNA ligase